MVSEEILTFAADFRIKGFVNQWILRLFRSLRRKHSGKKSLLEWQSRIVLTKIALHEVCKMDFCCITN